MWNPIWHQAITHSLMDGKAFGSKKTVIFKIHTPISGTKLRFCFSNRLGAVPYEIGAMKVKANNHLYPVTIKGKQSFNIPTGGSTFSDELNIPIRNNTDIEIRLYYKNAIADCNMIEEEATLLSGNQVSISQYEMKKPLLAKILGAYNAVPTIERIDIFSERETKSIVAFGDSITALSQWTKPLAKRLEQAYGDEYILLNSGISGNCLLYKVDGIFGPVFGDMGTKRFERDVLDIANIHAVILGLGVNDVSYYTDKTKDRINLEAYQREITTITDELHKRGIRVIMQTISPRLGVARTMGKYTRPMEEQRLLFNEWIRSSDNFDYVFDAEKVVREERADGYYYGEGLHRGDHLHPNAAGGQRLADVYDLKKLTGKQ